MARARALSYAKKGVPDESPVRSRVASSLASCRGESLEPHECPRRARNELQGEVGEFRGGAGVRRGSRRRGQGDCPGEQGAHHECRRRVRSGSQGVPRLAARHWRIRLVGPRDAASGRRAPWRNLAVRYDWSFVQVRQPDWRIAPGGERSFDRERAVRRSTSGVGHRLMDVPEGFGEKEESKRPRASLHVGQNWPDRT